jgi:ABC-type multidrug transport system fused ATPase/permease subunit
MKSMIYFESSIAYVLCFCYCIHMNYLKKYLQVYEKALPIFKIFSKKDKRQFIYITIIQGLAALMDLIGIFLVGITGSLIASYLIDANLNSMVISFIDLLGLNSYSPKLLIVYCSLFIVLFFVLKTILSVYMNKKILLFYAKKQREFSVSLYSKVLDSSYAWLKTQNTERIYSAIATGADAIFIRLVSNLILIVSDIFLLFFILIFLLVFNPIVSLFTFLYFFLIAVFLQRIIGKRAMAYGSISTESSMESHRNLNIMLSSFKEIFVMNKKTYFRNRFANSEYSKSIVAAKSMWIQQLPKYIFEIGLVIGIFLLSFSLLMTSVSNITTLTIFIVASGRLVPALFRIQSGIFSLLSGYSDALLAVKFLDNLQLRNGSVPDEPSGFLNNPPSIEIQSLAFKFPDSKNFLLKNITINISSGEVVALVGGSGSGKTTLVDIILNIYMPSEGRIVIRDGVKQVTPGRVTNISYVTQNPLIFRGTVLENIVFGNDGEIDEESLDHAITNANLGDLIKRLPEGINTELSNVGGILSGGEKQRIAIARALYLKPKLLIIDEGTSSLDYTSENLITQTLMSLEGKVTIIIIAHRITTIKNVNNIYFMGDGKIMGAGNYFSLQKAVPEFKNWVQQMNSDTSN